MQRFSLSVAILTLFLASLLPSWARAQDQEQDSLENPARVGLFVFERGRPVADLTVELREVRGSTNADGAWRAAVSPGGGRLEVREHGLPLLALPLTLEPGESLQLIVTLTGEDRRAMVSMESSHERQAMAREQVTPQTPEGVGSGVLTGRVLSSEDGAPVAGARIFVSGTPVEGRTDNEGRYRLEVDAGEYAISVLHSEFATRTVRGVLVAADSETERDFEIPPAGLELAEFVVIEPFIQGSITAAYDERRQSASVAEILGAEQISRGGDSDAAGALKRVTGLTLIDGQYIFIRGLGERYSSTLLNGATVPSPDPTRKVVPLDLFPAGVIESIRVQKGFSPEYPADFGGGAVEIRTSGIPEENFLTLGLSVGWRQGSTFKDGRTYNGGSRDWLGFDDGTRELPRAIQNELDQRGSLLPFNPITRPDGLQPEELAELGRSLPVIYNQQLEEIRPDQGVDITGGMRFDFGRWVTGFKSAVLWSDGARNREENRRTFTIGAGELQNTKDFQLSSTRRTVRLSGVNTLEASYADLHRFSYSTILLRLTTDDADFLRGFDQNERGNQTVRRYELEFEERQLLSHQFRGEHRAPGLGDLTVDWQYSQSGASRDAPDNRIYRFDNDTLSPTGWRYSTRNDNNFRNFSELSDDATEYGIDLALPFSLGPAFVRLSAGWQQHERERDSQVIRLKLFNEASLSLEERRQEDIEQILGHGNIGPGRLFLRESTRPTDKAEAFLDIEAAYFNADVQLTDWLRLTGGVRMEDWIQASSTFELFVVNPSPIEAELSSKDWFPAFSVTWSLTDRQSILASYAETIVRPDLREISPAPFTDPVLDREVRGNPELVQSELVHYDLRYDFVISPAELFSFGLFYKLIDNPIERGQLPGEDELISFSNVQEAEVYGIEVELNKNLGFVGDWVPGLRWMDSFEIATNAAWIESKINVDPQAAGLLTSGDRSLQGQSPYVVNFRISYQHPDERFDANLLYNVAGKRISEFGVLGQPDLYERPSARLDANFSYRWTDRLRLKMKLGNLLDARFQITQGDEVTQEYRSGRTLSIGVDVALF